MRPSPFYGSVLSPEMARRLVRYAIVGAVVMAVFTGMNWLLGQRFGKDVSFLVAYPPAVALHFWLNKRWTFGCRRSDAKRQVSEYLAMVLVTFLIQAAVFALLTRLTTMPGWCAAGAANGSQMIITFLAMQYRIFRPQAGARKDPSGAIP